MTRSPLSFTVLELRKFLLPPPITLLRSFLKWSSVGRGRSVSSLRALVSQLLYWTVLPSPEALTGTGSPLSAGIWGNTNGYKLAAPAPAPAFSSMKTEHIESTLSCQTQRTGRWVDSSLCICWMWNKWILHPKISLCHKTVDPVFFISQEEFLWTSGTPRCWGHPLLHLPIPALRFNSPSTISCSMYNHCLLRTFFRQWFSNSFEPWPMATQVSLNTHLYYMPCPLIFSILL